MGRQRGVRISTAMASITLLWRQHGHVVGCDHSARRRTTALPPFFVRTTLYAAYQGVHQLRALTHCLYRLSSCWILFLKNCKY